MPAHKKIDRSHTVFPSPLSFPLRIIPSLIHSKVLAMVLNKIFHNNLKYGELDFLCNKVINITIDDIGIKYRFTLDNKKIMPCKKDKKADLILNGNLYDYLLLISRHEDTDTLFFSRRLHMKGDTELGLFVKNFLDGLDTEPYNMPGYIESVLHKSLSTYERLFM